MNKKTLTLIFIITSLETLAAANTNEIKNKAKTVARKLVNQELQHLLTPAEVQEDFLEYDATTQKALKDQLEKFNIIPTDELIEITFNELHAYCTLLIKMESLSTVR